MLGMRWYRICRPICVYIFSIQYQGAPQENQANRHNRLDPGQVSLEPSGSLHKIVTDLAHTGFISMDNAVPVRHTEDHININSEQLILP